MTSLPIMLPIGSKPSVNIGDSISVGQTIAIKNTKSEELINIADQLSVPISRAGKYVKKSPGDVVKKGEALAYKKGFLGLSSTVVRSRVSGTVIRYERDNGSLVIRIPGSSMAQEVISPVAGIVGLCDNKQIVINTEKNVLNGLRAIGGSGQGEVVNLEKDDAFFINGGMIGKIIVGRNFNREMLVKGIGIGVAGIVGSRIADKDLEHIKSKGFVTPIIEMPEDNLKKIAEWQSKKIYIDCNSKSIIFLSI